MNLEMIWTIFEKEKKQTKYHFDERVEKQKQKQNLVSYDTMVINNNSNNSYGSYRERCDACHQEVRLDEGFLVCSNISCGRIYKEVLDECAEWKYYNTENNLQDPTRCGMPINPLLQESSYSCKMICKNNTSQINVKLRKYIDWSSMPYNEKILYDEFERIKILANISRIPKCIVDDALKYYKKISIRMSRDKTIYRTLKKDGIIAASIYISGRLNNFPRTPKEIATIFKLDKGSATRGCKKAISLLNEMEINIDDKHHSILYQTKPLSFIERYCSNLNMSKSLTLWCKEIAIKIENNNLVEDNNPNSVAVGIIYFVSNYCNLNISKLNVSKISDISEVTINKCSKKLESMVDKFHPCIIYCEKLNMSKEITQLCKNILLQINKETVFDELTKDIISVGIILYVCDVCNLNISVQDIQNVSDIHESTILKSKERIHMISSKIDPCIIYCNNLSLTSEITRLCQFIYIKLHKNKLLPIFDNIPQNAIITGIIYFVTQTCKIQVDIHKIHSVTLIDIDLIQKCYHILSPMTKDIFPSIIKNKYNII